MKNEQDRVHVQRRNPFQRGLRFLVGVCALTLGSCTTPVDLDPSMEGPLNATSKSDPLVPRPWTTAFNTPTLLIADKVYIEGPRGLMEHAWTRTEDGFHKYEAKTLPEGFLQRFEVLRHESGVELRTYLDKFEIVAFRELVLLERPGDVNVLLRVTGEAFWRDVNTGVERRAPEFTFAGVIEPVSHAEPDGALLPSSQLESSSAKPR